MSFVRFFQADTENNTGKDHHQMRNNTDNIDDEDEDDNKLAFY